MKCLQRLTILDRYPKWGFRATCNWSEMDEWRRRAWKMASIHGWFYHWDEVLEHTVRSNTPEALDAPQDSSSNGINAVSSKASDILDPGLSIASAAASESRFNRSSKPRSLYMDLFLKPSERRLHWELNWGRAYRCTFGSKWLDLSYVPMQAYSSNWPYNYPSQDSGDNQVEAKECFLRSKRPNFP